MTDETARRVRVRPDSPTSPICGWYEDEDAIWHTACGHQWFFDSGTPEDNGQKFCGYCGRSLVVVERPAVAPAPLETEG